MELTDWIVILAAALIAIAFFCLRAPTAWSLENRVRRFTGARLLVQAAIALWSALLLLQRGVFSLDDIAGLRPTPHVVIACALMLGVAACYWSVRGTRLLKPRQLFATSSR
ncbi:hypothetical protein [Paraburkholderia sartisoli]|uniref:Uncharacterized protein n=1 Tax=Paraburkholderia sartisoli TaxID=83784 RepID=A0A1H4EJK1_9BURK|nr:hypothetical protein [Paraburkholderia sartisoli]SEA84432.1 hypothetical protein SAMN05192564_103368 [Paraburkholderia sartisoli]